MVVFAEFTYKYKGLPKINKRETGRLRKETYRVVGRRWHKRNRPKHFTERGGREYHYLRRSRRYVQRKKSLYGHRRPLEYTGEAKRLARIARIRPSSKGVRITMSQLRKLNWRHPKSQINMASEMRRVSSREIRKFTEIGNKDLEQRLKRYNRQRTVKAA